MNNSDISRETAWKRKRLMGLAAFGGLGLIGTGAVAAETDASSAASAMEDIVVTAEKRGSGLQKTALAITALTGEDLVKSNVDSVMSLQASSPSLVVGGLGGFGQPYIRGVGNEQLTIAGDSSTSVYLDGVYLSRSGSALSQFLDVNRVEILHGPQGTLYGRNVVGGSINIYTNKPKDNFEGNVSVGYGNFDRFEARAVVNLPVVDDRLSARFSAIRRSSRGYMTNLTPYVSLGGKSTTQNYGGDDLIAGRASFLYQPNDDLEIFLTFDATRDRGTQTSTFSLNTDLPTAPGIGRTGPSPYENYLNFTPSEKKDQRGVNLTADWSLGVMTLRSISSYRYNLQDVVFDVDGTDADLNSERLYSTSDTWTQEFNLISESGGPLEWVAGVYYFRDEAEQFVPVSLNLGTLLLDFDGTLETSNWAGFGQATYSITDRLRATMGIRYSKEKKEITTNHKLNQNLALVTNASRKWDAWTPKFGLSMQVNRDLLIYAQASKGFKSGGFNLLSFDPATFAFDPENMWAYEAGLKSDWLDRRLRFNLTGFWYDQSNLQQQVASAFGAVVANAASATIKGIEIETKAVPVTGLQLTGSYSYLDARFDKYLTLDPDRRPLGILDLRTRLPRAPKHAFTVGANYEHSLGSEGSLNWFIQYSYKSRVYYDVYNEVRNSQKGLGLLTARTTYRSEKYPFWVAVWGKNLTNKLWYQTAIRNTDFFGTTRLPAEPRTYGIEMGVNF